jgi:hypothetical protein
MFTDVSEVLAAFTTRAVFALMMEKGGTSEETLVNFYQITRCNNPENNPSSFSPP